MEPTKAMTIRLSAELAEQLETVAAVDDQPIAEAIRAAIGDHIRARIADENFQSGLRERLSRTERLLTAREEGDR